MTSSHDDPPAEPATVRAEGTGHAQMPILGSGVQHNMFASGGNGDVVLVLTHEKNVVELRSGASAVFSLEVANHGNRTLRLALRAVGVPAASCSIVPGSIVVRPNETQTGKVVLRARASTPEAGERELAIAAADTDAVTKSDGRWLSNKKQVRVLPKPNYTVGVTVPPVRTDDPGTYRTTVKVTNSGNTRLSGSIDVPEAEWIRASTKAEPAGRLVDPALVRLPGEFELGPGADAEIPVTITFPDEPATDQRWELVLRVSTARSGLNDRLCRVPLVRPAGTAGAAPETPPPAPAAESWLLRGVRVPFPALVLGLAGAVAAGMFAAVAIRPAAVAVTPAKLAASAPAQPSTAAPSQLSVPAADAPDIYSDMPCTPGTWIVMIATALGTDTDSDVAKLMRYESDRARFIDKQHKYAFKATPYSFACPKARALITRKDKMSTRLVWTGPVASEVAAEQTCTRLRKVTQWDCYTRPAA